MLDLSEPIDVYSDFIEACKEAQERGSDTTTHSSSLFQKVPMIGRIGEEP
jgi:transcription elongation factor Elf1